MIKASPPSTVLPPVRYPHERRRRPRTGEENKVFGVLSRNISGVSPGIVFALCVGAVLVVAIVMLAVR